MNIVKLTDQIVKDGKLTRKEYQMFVRVCKADGRIDKEERLQVLRIYLLWTTGRLIFVD